MAQIVLTAVASAKFGAVGGAIGGAIGSFIDSALFSSDQNLPDRIGPRLDNLKVQSSVYGKMVPQVFGYMRLGGNIIWSQDIREVENRETSTSGGGKGGGGGQVNQTNVTYTYFVTLAIAICDGSVDEVIGVWADSKKLDARTIEQSSGGYEVHLGGEDQAVSSIIENYEGVGNTAAYRGTAYIVIEDFPLADYGNRIPNFTFEVRRTTQIKPTVEDKVKDVVIIPGSGEFVYATTIAEKYDVTLINGGQQVQTSKAKAVNMHNFENTANANLAVQQMLDALPNLQWVAIIVNWFITSKDMSIGTIVPKVEFSNAEGQVVPIEWEVAGLTRATAQVVQKFPDGSVTYGGTPSDHSIIELCTALKNAGLKILFYPMPLVDTVDETAGEDDKPWRGRITPTSEAECNNWFTQIQGYNAFIRHYSTLPNLADNIDAFVIGTEMVGITTFDSGSNNYPGVNNFKTLASLVKSDMPSVPITYAADWSEYHSIGGYYHLDPLWSDSNIDFVGIDNYMPITPDLDQSQITEDLIKQYWQDGEGWSYFYADSVARTGKTDYTPNDGTSPFAWKNIEAWWNSTHTNPDLSVTAWTAKMKPIWFTEFGFPSVDGSANQPNVFVDPTSVESFYPRGSKRRIDFLAQREAINATIDFWQNKNAETGNSDLVPRMFLWTWDARPYPFFPDLLGVWADGVNWRAGHWVNGKFGISGLGAIISELLNQVGFNQADYDVTQLDDPVEGYVLNTRSTIRGHLELLRSIYFFDVVESDGVIKFIKRGAESQLTIAEDYLIPEANGNIRRTANITRKQELELPQQVNLSFIDRIAGYSATTQIAQRQVTNAKDKIGVNAPIIMQESEGRSRAEKSLYASWVARNLFEFSLPPKYVFVESGDIITLNINNIDHVVRVVSTQLSRNGSQKIKALSDDVSAYDFYIDPSQRNSNTDQGTTPSASQAILMDLPRFPSDTGDIGDMRIAINGLGEGWTGGVLYASDDGGENGGNSYFAVDNFQSEAITGLLLEDLSAGPRNTWDFANYIEIAILSGNLSSVTELAVLNGANLILVGNELIQFQNAEIVENNRYRLSKLLRGRLGTEHEMGTQVIGDQVVFIDSSIVKTPMPISSFGLEKYYKPVTIGQTLAETDEQSFTYNGIKFRPYSPVDITGVRDGSSNLTISWKRRTRINGEWRDNVDVPIGEESEKYEIDIMDGLEVVRTIESSTESTIYTASEQIQDFAITPASINVKIYQVSATFGRGTAGQEII